MTLSSCSTTPRLCCHVARLLPRCAARTPPACSAASKKDDQRRRDHVAADELLGRAAWQRSLGFGALSITQAVDSAEAALGPRAKAWLAAAENNSSDSNFALDVAVYATSFLAVCGMVYMVQDYFNDRDAEPVVAPTQSTASDTASAAQLEASVQEKTEDVDSFDQPVKSQIE